MSVKNDLIAEFDAEIEEVAAMDVGSEKHEKATAALMKYTDRIIEFEKLEAENEFKEKQLKAEQRDRMIKNGIAVGTAVASLAAYAWAFVSSMNFEKEGTLTTEGGRNALKGLLRLKF